jgi:hypothetical protein
MTEFTPERFEELMAMYGSDSNKWPAKERQAALSYVGKNPTAAREMQLWQAFDMQLQSFAVPTFSGLEARLLRQRLPVQQRGLADHILAWLFPEPHRMLAMLWRPAALAVVPLALGLFVGSVADMTVDGYAMSSFDEELYFLSLSDYAESI